MIQPNELRRGNWVQIQTKTDCGILLSTERVDEINDNGVRIKGNIGYLYNEINPIPLTPEILEKAGFTAESEIYYALGFVILKYNDDYQTWEFKIETSWAETRTIGLRYVHQLQNLYFALTGTELEIKL